MLFGMTLAEFIGLIAGGIALVVTIYRARITPTAEAVKLLLEPLNESLSNCSDELDKKEREIKILVRDHDRWKTYVVGWVKKLTKELETLQKELSKKEGR